MWVTSREGRVSRNVSERRFEGACSVTSREGRVSRNFMVGIIHHTFIVTSREGRVSRNIKLTKMYDDIISHVPRGTCE